MSSPYAVRTAAPGDLEAIAGLFAEHALFERNPTLVCIDPSKLGRALFAEAPPLHALVASHDAGLIGYATFTLDFSTWRLAPYLHLDCLYIQRPHRRAGVGRLLMAWLADEARSSGCSVAEWQTPHWNVPAAGFYQMLGAEEHRKLRFVWQFDNPAAHGESPSMTS